MDHHGGMRKGAAVSIISVALLLAACGSSSTTASKKELSTYEAKVIYLNKHFCGSFVAAGVSTAFAEYLTYHNWQTQDETNLSRKLAEEAYSEGHNNCSDRSVVNQLFINELALDHDLGGTVNGWP